MTYLQHIVLALCIQAAIGVTTTNWWAGAGVACAYFIGREVAQAEYRWIERLGSGLRRNMPWWGPLDPRVWTTLDQSVDWLGPILATTVVAWLASGM